MKKKRILYLMHVHWGWIKQRPHFIAECLAEEYDITVCFKKTYRSRCLTFVSSESKIKLKELFILPFGRFKLIASFNNWLISKQLSGQLNNCDIIWLTHPDMYDAVKNKLPHDSQVVYDCMDDALEFPCVASKPSIRKLLASKEYLLIKRSTFILATTHYLKNKLLERYETKKEIHVINNAINIYENGADEDVKLSSELMKTFSSTKTKKLVYIGTISEWLDFDLILKSAEQFPNIIYILIGPADVAIPEHKQIVYFPPVEHKKIYKIMELADVLVMPFLINELILAVNPVKVYEYIYSVTPAIVSRYQETEKFSKFVYLYKSELEYLNLIEQVATDKLVLKSVREDYLSYARQNTWTARVFEICKILEQ